MDHGFDAVLTGKALFDAVGQFVCFLECHSVRHFQVQRHHPAAGTVVMDHQVVHAENIFVVHYRCGYVFYKILVRLLTKQRIYGFDNGAEAGNQNENRNAKSQPGVYSDMKEKPCQLSQQNESGCNCIISGIKSCGCKRYTVQILREPSVVAEHIQFDRNRQHKNQGSGGCERGFLRMQDFAQRFPRERKAHDADQRRNQHAGDVFDSSVPERMPRVRFVAGKPEADHRDDTGPRVGEVVERVGNNRDRV